MSPPGECTSVLQHPRREGKWVSHRVHLHTSSWDRLLCGSHPWPHSWVRLYLVLKTFSVEWAWAYGSRSKQGFHPTWERKQWQRRWWKVYSGCLGLTHFVIIHKFLKTDLCHEKSNRLFLRRAVHGIVLLPKNSKLSPMVFPVHRSYAGHLRFGIVWYLAMFGLQ